MKSGNDTSREERERKLKSIDIKAPGITISLILLAILLAFDAAILAGGSDWIAFGRVPGVVREAPTGHAFNDGQGIGITEIASLRALRSGKNRLFVITYASDAEGNSISLRRKSDGREVIELALPPGRKAVTAYVDASMELAGFLARTGKGSLSLDGLGFPPILLPGSGASIERARMIAIRIKDYIIFINAIVFLAIALIITLSAAPHDARETPRARFIFASLFSLLCTAVVLLLEDALARFDYDALFALAESVSMFRLSSFRPEPRESLLFWSMLIGGPVFFIVGWALAGFLGRRTLLARNGSTLIVVATVLAAVWSIAAFLAPDEAYRVTSRFLFAYLKNTIFINPSASALGRIWITGPISLAIASAALAIPFWRWGGSAFPKLPVIGWTLGASAAALTFWTYLIWNPTAGYLAHTHFSAVFDSIARTATGAIPLVDGFSNTYGLYAIPMGWAYAATGSPSAVAAIFSALNGASVFMVFDAFRRRMKNAWLAGLAALLVAWIGFILPKLNSWDIYYQNAPIRTLFPIISFWLASIAGKRIADIKTYAGLALAVSIGFFWNHESTIVALLALGAASCWAVFDPVKPLRSLGRCSLRLAVIPAGPAIMAGAYWLFVRIIAGKGPNLANLFISINQFGALGYYNLGAPVLHPWNLYVLLTFGVLFFLVQGKVEGKARNTDAPLFLAAVAALGFLRYYQGRSHTFTFFNIELYPVLLLAWIACRVAGALSPGPSVRRLKDIIAERAALTWVMKALAISAFFSFGVGSALTCFPAISSFSRAMNASNGSVEEAGRIASFVDSNAEPGEPVLLLIRPGYHALVTARIKAVDACVPALVDMFSMADFDRLKSMIIDGGLKVFLDDGLDESSYRESLEDIVRTARGSPAGSIGSIWLFD